MHSATTPGQWPITGLPISAQPLRYDGTLAVRSQLTRSDGFGELIFFAVDGNIYDTDGRLMADANGPGCTQCVEPGVMEMVAVPYPGSCSSFYLLSATLPSSNPTSPNEVRISVSMLDMDAPNPYWPGENGALMNLFDGEVVTKHPALVGWDLELQAAIATYVSDHATALPQPSSPVLLGSSLNSPQIRVIDPVGDGELYWMYVIMKNEVLPYRIDATGIRPVITAQNGVVPLYPFGGSAEKSYARDADVALDANGNIVLALSDCNVGAYNAGTGMVSGSYQLMVHRYNGVNGAFIDATGHELIGQPGLPDFDCFAQLNGGGLIPPPAPMVRPGLNGVALIANATRVILTGERVNANSDGWLPAIGELDLATSQWTDIGALLSIPDQVNYVRARIHRNRVPGSAATAIYFPYPIGSGQTGGVASLLNVEDLAQASFIPSLSPTLVNTPQFVPPLGSGSGFYRPIFLNTQITQDDYLVNWESRECCLEKELQGAVAGHIHSGTGILWTPSSHPFGNVTEFVFANDLVVPAGTSLQIDGMVLRFGPGAKLIVERNAQLVSLNTHFTAVGCNSMWPGIQVEGTTSDTVQSGAGHGQLSLSSCIVEHAHTGVFSGRRTVSGIFTAVSPLHYGGKVTAVGTTFRNCGVGLQFDRYRRLIDGTEYRNLSSVRNCTFEFTDEWRGGAAAGIGVRMERVYGLLIQTSRFLNQHPEHFGEVQNRGIGIRSNMAGFICIGAEGNSDGLFQDLHTGILASSFAPGLAYHVQDMTFLHNMNGILDMGSRDPVILRNTFTTLPSATPQPSSSSIGLHLRQTERYIVERNTFLGGGGPMGSTGIWFTGPTSQDNRIYDNDFADLNMGCVVENRHLAQGLPQEMAPGLQMLCGDHTNNKVDQFILGQQGYIAYNQGAPISGFTTANNAFNSPVSCSTSGPGPNFHPFVLALFGNYPLGVRYHVYDPAQSPQMRPDCIENADGSASSFIGEWFYDLEYVATAEEFNRPDHCGQHQGVLRMAEPEDRTALEALYAQKLAEVQSAHAQYFGTVDKMRTDDLLGMVEYQPWHPSHALRDTLLANHPLSDEVIYSVLERGEPLDQWHLVQVLVQNSPLSPWVWQQIEEEELLSPYFYNLLRQHQQGSGLRQMLEQEVVQRQREKTAVQQRLVQALLRDSTATDRLQALEAILLADSLGDGLQDLYLFRLEHDPAAAATMEQALLARREQDLLAYGQVYTALAGDWEALEPAQADVLWNLVFDPESRAATLAWTALYSANMLDSLPAPEEPPLLKSLFQRPPKRYHTVQEQLLHVMPNPAVDRVAFTYPAAVEDGLLEILDAQGRLVRQLPLNGRRALLETSVVDLRPGIYLARLQADGLILDAVRFTVVR